MADFDYVPCPRCRKKFMVGEEFFRLADAPWELRRATQSWASRSAPNLSARDAD